MSAGDGFRLFRGLRKTSVSSIHHIHISSNFAVWPEMQITSYEEVPPNVHAKGHATFTPKVTLPLPKGQVTFTQRSGDLCRKIRRLLPRQPA